MMKRILKIAIVEPKGSCCTGTVIVLHGAGGTGPTLHSWWKQEIGHPLQFEQLRFIFPTAVPIPYAAAQGLMMHAWINRRATDISVPEIIPSIDETVQSLSQLIDNEVKKGIPINRIIIGGFSMGGTMALHVGYGSRQGVRGVFAMSSFLNHDSILYKALDRYEGSKPPLFQSHGSEDLLVLPDWGAETHRQLTRRGVTGELISAPGYEHELDGNTLTQLHQWITKQLPALPVDDEE